MYLLKQWPLKSSTPFYLFSSFAPVPPPPKLIFLELRLIIRLRLAQAVKSLGSLQSLQKGSFGTVLLSQCCFHEKSWCLGKSPV